jgi:uncharacterized cupin superfamily protein
MATVSNILTPIPNDSPEQLLGAPTAMPTRQPRPKASTGKHSSHCHCSSGGWECKPGTASASYCL